MRLMRKTLLAAIALGAFAVAPGAAFADCRVGDCWGAVAYGPGGAWAYAVNMPTRVAASRAAQARCRGSCTNVLTFHNSCGAYATGFNGYGWGNDMTREAAEARALYECRLRSNGCAIRVWGCTTR